MENAVYYREFSFSVRLRTSHFASVAGGSHSRRSLQIRLHTEERKEARFADKLQIVHPIICHDCDRFLSIQPQGCLN